MTTAANLLASQIAAAEARLAAAEAHPLVVAYFARRKAAAAEVTDLLGSAPETPYTSIEEAVAVTQSLAAGSELYRLNNTAV